MYACVHIWTHMHFHTYLIEEYRRIVLILSRFLKLWKHYCKYVSMYVCVYVMCVCFYNEWTFRSVIYMMCVCMLGYIHICIHAYIHACIHTVHTFIDTHKRTYVHTYIHTYIHSSVVILVVIAFVLYHILHIIQLQPYLIIPYHTLLLIFSLGSR